MRGIERLSTLDDVAFDVSISLTDMPLPRTGAGSPGDEHRFVQYWPRVAKFYREYDPHE